MKASIAAFLICSGAFLPVAFAESVGTSESLDARALSGSKTSPTIMTVNLARYELTVSKDGKDLAKFPVSYGGPATMPKCDEPKSLKEHIEQKCPTPPRLCKVESPPNGEYPVISTSKTYRSQVLNTEFENVVQFGDSFVLRSINATVRGSKPVGEAQFTCGQIVLRQADAEKIFEAINKSQKENFKVRVISK